MAASASGARPRLVWMMTPVALMTGCSDGRNASSSRDRGGGFDAGDDGRFGRERRVAAGDGGPHVGGRRAQRVDGRLGAESRLERAHRRPLAQLLDRRNRSRKSGIAEMVCYPLRPAHHSR